jgi:hypothetical protein
VSHNRTYVPEATGAVVVQFAVTFVLDGPNAVMFMAAIEKEFTEIHTSSLDVAVLLYTRKYPFPTLPLFSLREICPLKELAFTPAKPNLTSHGAESILEKFASASKIW